VGRRSSSAGRSFLAVRCSRWYGREHKRRPEGEKCQATINSYMFGNAKALAEIAELAGKSDLARFYRAKADTLKILVETQLWNSDEQFFEVLKEDLQFSGAREAIGFIPWYFNLPSEGYEAAWEQVLDDQVSMPLSG